MLSNSSIINVCFKKLRIDLNKNTRGVVQYFFPQNHHRPDEGFTRNNIVICTVYSFLCILCWFRIERINIYYYYIQGDQTFVLQTYWKSY